MSDDRTTDDRTTGARAPDGTTPGARAPDGTTPGAGAPDGTTSDGPTTGGPTTGGSTTGGAAPAVEEPRLTTRRTDRRRAPRHVLAVLPFAVAGLISLLLSGNTLRPLEHITTIEARMASKSDYFKDPEVQRLLLRHGLRVDIHRLGSRGIATQSLRGMDVVFPSGQPAAKLILDRQDRSVRSVRPFVSPLVLGTFHDYAETLVEAGVATPQPAPGRTTLYYDLDMVRFMRLLDGVDDPRSPKDGTGRTADTWNGIGYDDITRDGGSNSGRVLVRTSNVCESNAAGTYLSLLAFVANGNRTPGTRPPGTRTPGARTGSGARPAADAVQRLAAEIKPLIDLQGMWADEQAESYFSDLGESIAPVSLLYEHQYLAHQIAHHDRNGEQDTSRVLLYPTPYALTEPQLISLTGRGDRLVEVIQEDEDLRRRAIELGFRVRFSGADGTSDQLNAYLAEHAIQVPRENSDRTKVYEPDLEVLEEIIDHVGDCPPPVRDTP
ncbi:hypothetical protein [Streptomyces glaucescens]|uniref:Putative membrane protein n=1 Tax=Streptomyces glaucescens TaxID=1907 RepID=A0A089XAE8_STRGA|nr:hypothetical protein [Streptomyces glaucescens]AIR98129.1 putative membrane protein [Streptomyces glaucescens]